MAFLMVKKAVERHAGHLEQYFSPEGTFYIQIGKDLSDIKNVIGTGGILKHSTHSWKILSGALTGSNQKESVSAALLPSSAKLWIDRDYILTNLGLLVNDYPEITFQLLKNALVAENVS